MTIRFRGLTGLVVICLLVTNQTSCFIAERAKKQQVRKEQAIKDLRELCRNLPPPTGFGNKPPVETLDIGKVVITYKYTSKAPCENTANHYKNLLAAKGWDVSKMEQYKTRGGMSTIDTNFRRDDYLVTVSCEAVEDYDKFKQYGLYCSWGLK